MVKDLNLSHADVKPLRPLTLALLTTLLAMALNSPAALAQDDQGSAVEAVAGEEQKPPPEEPPAPGSDPETEDGGRAALKLEIEGYLMLDTRLRSVNSETDLDVYTHVYADVTYRGDTVLKTRVNGRFFADVGGDQGEGDLLRDIWDGFGHDVQFRLYEAYVEGQKLFNMELSMRGGRQFLDEGIWLHVDGVRADATVSRTELTVLFGVPVFFGEPSRGSNWVAGVVARFACTKRTRVRVSYYHVSEAFEGINAPVTDPLLEPVSIPAQDFEDDLFGVTIWHRFKKTLRFFGRFTILNGDANELHLRLRWFTDDGRWTVVLEWYQLFERLQNVTNDLTPFVPMLGSYEPFYRVLVRATRRFGEAWIVQAGLSHRELDQQASEGTFNHEYDHYYVSGTRTGLMDNKLDATLTANGYSSSSNDVAAVAGSLTYAVSSTVQVSAGLDYSFFKYIWFQNRERESVWTPWVRVRWDARKDVRATAGLSIDDDRFDTYTTFFVRLTVRF